MKPKIDYTLYLVTDQRLMSAASLDLTVEQAILGGCTLIQLREKDISSLEFYSLAVRIKGITDLYNVPLIINDRIDIALAVDAAGVHIGQDDMPLAAARQILGNDKIIGVSVSSVKEAVWAQRDSADYLGVGAMFPTGTKTDSAVISINELRQIRGNVNIPIVTIGGINKNNIHMFRGTGTNGIAVVSAIISQLDIQGAANELKLRFAGECHE